MTLIWGQQARLDRREPIATHVHWILLLDEEFQPNIIPHDNRTVLNPALRQRLEKEIASFPKAPPFICASIGGNEYAIVGHTEHPRPFDFSLPGRPDLPVRSGVEIIAPSLMRKTMERSVEHPLSLMTALREATTIPIVFIQSPPPIPSTQHIRENPGPFRDAIEETGVAPASLRMKLWLLQSSIYRQRCEELGCRYLEVPDEAVDEQGFLHETGWWRESLHANIWYGEAVLRKIDLEFRESCNV